MAMHWDVHARTDMPLCNATQQVADYPFTTLVPNLGVCELDYRTTVFADVPGRVLWECHIPLCPYVPLCIAALRQATVSHACTPPAALMGPWHRSHRMHNCMQCTLEGFARWH